MIKGSINQEYITIVGNSLAVLWLGPGAFTARTQIQSLVRDLRSCKPCSAAEKQQKKEYITIVNIYAPNQSTQIYKQKLIELKGEITYNKIIVGDFNIPLSTIDRSSTQRISKETEDLNNTRD